ncbi:hypothetical protein [uncultured Aquimarina sp.]|uniref:hypothetical protein n=1 Tax=uncultured Aquimarina sp. TaxID=575652 RepID=UPI002636F90D|nr:hypothetical protein [uncultured Aquimarina sp.]
MAASYKIIFNDNETSRIKVNHKDRLLTVRGSQIIKASSFDENNRSTNMNWLCHMFQNDPRENNNYFKINKQKISFLIPTAYLGGGIGWVEPVKEGEKPTYKTSHGYYIQGFDQPEIISTEWREYSKYDNGALIEGDKYFGEFIQLHIYTKGLYGQNVTVQLRNGNNENIDLEVKSKSTEDEKGNRTSEKKYMDKYTSTIFAFEEVGSSGKNTYIQKTVVNVRLEQRWRLQYNEEIKLKAIIDSTVKGCPTFKSDTIKVKVKQYEDTAPTSIEKQGNQAVQISDFTTSIFEFNPCRYDKIIKEYGSTTPETLFSTSENINVPIKNIDIGVVVAQNSTDTLSISIEDLDVEKCLRDAHSKPTTIDITHLQEDYPKAKIEGDTKLTFVPTYKYEYLDPLNYYNFFVTYFPIFKRSEKNYKILVNSCAFEKEIQLSVLPDVAFATHFQIGKPKDFTDQNKIYYRNIDLDNDLVRGLDKEFDKAKQMRAEVGKYLPQNPFSEFAQDILLDYLKEKANKFAIGLHAYHTFSEDGKKAELINYAKEYEVLSKLVIGYSLLVSVAVDALILWLTRGRYAFAKGAQTAKKLTLVVRIKKGYKTYRKIKRYQKTGKAIITGNLIDPAKPNGEETEFMWPQLSEHRGIGYVNNEDGSVGLELTHKLSASPLFAMQHTMKGTLGSLIASFLGITKIFDTAEQAVGVVGHLRTLKSAKEDIQKASKKRKGSSNESADISDDDEGFDWKKLFKFRDLQKGLDGLEKIIHKRLEEYTKKKLGASVSVELEATGFFTADYEFRLNLHKKTLELDIQDNDYGLLKYEHPRQLTFGQDYGIDLLIKLDANVLQTQKWSRMNNYLPDFLGVTLKDTRVTADIQGQVRGSLNFERTFTYINHAKPVYRDTLIFTGVVLQGYVLIKVEQEKDIGDDYGEVFKTEVGTATEVTQKVEDPETCEVSEQKVPQKQMVSMELIPAFTINMTETAIFDKETWKQTMQ